jgi:transitional endoplasmic reticulum ATPase
MDGAKGKPKDVLFVAATNYPDMIDDAMLRGGRFTEKIEFSLPDLSVLRDYIASWINSCKAPLSHDFTVENVAQMLRGQSLANVKVILQGSINESITRLSSDPAATVGLHDVESAMQLIAS